MPAMGSHVKTRGRVIRDRWLKMIRRHKDQVCAGWQIYENFREWALENELNIGDRIVRLSKEADYSPENCLLRRK